MLVRDLGFKFKDQYLFSGLNFTLEPGKIIHVTGSNGSGKTTLLEVLAGLKDANKGEILLNGKLVFSEHYAEYCQIITYIGHKLALKSQLSVIANLKFWADIYNSKEAVDAAIYYFNLGLYESSPVYELSAGYKKRVALARLLLSNASIWLLDEPFSNLDVAGAASLTNLINSKCSNGGRVIITGHENLSGLSCQLLPLEGAR